MDSDDSELEDLMSLLPAQTQASQDEPVDQLELIAKSREVRG